MASREPFQSTSSHWADSTLLSAGHSVRNRSTGLPPDIPTVRGRGTGFEQMPRQQETGTTVRTQTRCEASMVLQEEETAPWAFSKHSQASAVCPGQRWDQGGVGSLLLERIMLSSGTGQKKVGGGSVQCRGFYKQHCLYEESYMWVYNNRCIYYI